MSEPVDWVLLHGFVGSSEDFARLRGPLGRSGRVVAPDWPGHGARSGLRRPEDYSLEAHLRIIDAAVAETSGAVTLLGYSLGGRLLQHWLASRRPSLPLGSRLALVSTSPGIADPDERARRRDGDAAVARLLREEGLPRFLHYWHSQTMFQPLTRLPTETLSPILRRRGACDPEGLALSLEGVGAGAIPDTWGALPDVGLPTIIIAGELDGRYSGLADRMRSAIPLSAAVLIPGAGHALHLEKPDSLLEALVSGRDF